MKLYERHASGRLRGWDYFAYGGDTATCSGWITMVFEADGHIAQSESVQEIVLLTLESFFSNLGDLHQKEFEFRR